jgi:hypothetical protein
MSTTASREAFRARMLDDDNFSPPGSPQPAPVVASELIRRIGLKGTSPSEQEAGIRKWLVNNTPSESLQRSLRRKNFGFLLDELHH